MDKLDKLDKRLTNSLTNALGHDKKQDECRLAYRVGLSSFPFFPSLRSASAVTLPSSLNAFAADSAMLVSFRVSSRGGGAQARVSAPL